MTDFGRPRGAAYGRPFARPGLVTDCAHTRCWEAEPLAVPKRPLGTRSSPTDKGTLVAQLRPEPARMVRNYQSQNIPAERWGNVRTFTEDAVAVIAPACGYLAERLMVAVAPFVDWVVHVMGMPLVPNVFHPVWIRRYISRDDLGLKDRTLRDYRSLLLRISEALLPDEDAVSFGPLNGQSATAPYSDRELRLLEAWARGQATSFRRRNAGAILALGAGGGLLPWEMQHLRRRDISVDRHGVVVHVRSATPRDVPVLVRWEPLLRDSIINLGADAWVVGGQNRATTFNVVTPFINRTDFGSEPKPVPNRMRTTWLSTHLAALTDGGVLFDAAGLSKAEHLLTLLKHIPTLDTAEHRQRILAEIRGRA
ncbi:hypothetical protein [Curtobacterium sp. USHLN213]|uniref:hypothetical protein n=1 Tax=Curtobacterium sp. USHLN213 TaxID=3081255 RepID=UPI003017B45A